MADKDRVTRLMREWDWIIAITILDHGDELKDFIQRTYEIYKTSETFQIQWCGENTWVRVNEGFLFSFFQNFDQHYFKGPG